MSKKPTPSVPAGTSPVASPESRTLTKGAALISALIAAGTVLVLLGLLFYLAPMLTSFGLVGHLWYVLLVALGLAAGILVFALNKSWASYSGQALGGKLQFGGPVVVMFAMVVLGFWLVPAPAVAFDVTVFLESEPGAGPYRAAPGRESVLLELGADRKRESVDEKGIARFIGVPSSLRASEVVPILESDFRELVDPKQKVKISGEPLHLAVRIKSVLFRGSINDETGQPIEGAQITVQGQTVSSDAQGRFEMSVRLDLAEVDRFVEVTASGFQKYRAAFAPGSNALQVQLTRAVAVAKP